MATSVSVRRESVEEDALPETLIESLSEMYEKSQWTDTSFLCKDYEMAGETGKVTAHKNVLAARSPVFRAMFYGDLSEKTDEIFIADIDTDTFRSFLK